MRQDEKVRLVSTITFKFQIMHARLALSDNIKLLACEMQSPEKRISTRVNMKHVHSVLPDM